MDDLTQRIVEAGAREVDPIAMRDPSNDPEMVRRRKQAKTIARACLSAAHALAEPEGVIFTRVPEEVDISGGGHGDGYKLRTKMGWNNCRAAFLAGKVPL